MKNENKGICFKVLFRPHRSTVPWRETIAKPKMKPHRFIIQLEKLAHEQAASDLCPHSSLFLVILVCHTLMGKCFLHVPTCTLCATPAHLELSNAFSRNSRLPFYVKIVAYMQVFQTQVSLIRYVIVSIPVASRCLLLCDNFFSGVSASMSQKYLKTGKSRRQLSQWQCYGGKSLAVEQVWTLLKM